MLALVAALALAVVVLVGLPPSNNLGAKDSLHSPQSGSSRSSRSTDRWPTGTVVVKPAFTGSVTVLPPGRPALTVAVSVEVSGLAAAPAGTPAAGTVYATDATTGDLFTIVPPGRAEKLAAVGGIPGSLAVAPAAAGDAGDIYVLDQAMPFATVVTPDGAIRRKYAVGPTAVSTSFAGGAALVFGQGAGTADSPCTITRITPTATPAPTTVGLSISDMAVAPDGSPAAGTAYLTDPSDGSLMILSPSGDRRIVRGFQAPTAVTVASTAPGDTTVAVVDGSWLRILNGDGTSRSTLQLPGEPHQPVIAPAGTPRAGTIYAGVNAIGGLVAVDPGDDRLTRIKTGPLPIRMAVAPPSAPDSGDIYVVDRADNTLSRVDPVTLAVSAVPLTQESDDLVIVDAGR